MAERYNLRSTKHIVTGLFAGRKEDADDAPSDSESSSGSNYSDTLREEVGKHLGSRSQLDVSDSDSEQETSCVKSQSMKKKKEMSVRTQRLRRARKKKERMLPPKRTIRRSSTAFALANSPGPVGAAQEVTNALQAWSLLFTDELLEIIVLYTNKEILRVRATADPTCCSELTLVELKALLGLLYFSGLQKNNYINTDELWSPQFGSALYRATMPWTRFKFLLQTLRFDDKTTRNERRANDKFAPIREIWDIFIKNCKTYYNPHEYCTVQEELIPFRGSCSFMAYMPSKPKRYGIRMIMLNDELTFYMFDAKPYVGAMPSENFELVSYYRLKTITESIHGSKRTVACDKRFTVAESIQQMKQNCDLTIVSEDRQTVDYFEHLCREYSTLRRTARWPMAVLYGMLDQGGINAYIIYRYNKETEKINRLSFLQSLVMSLVEPHLKIRLEWPRLRRDLRVSIQNILNIEILPESTRTDQLKRCYICPRAKDRKSRVYCRTCNRHICEEHRVQVCPNCY